MAEAHPVGFQWVMEAKARGAKVIHVDPRFTRTSALADTYVPLRAGTDIVFLGGVINHVLQNELDFREYVVAYTNAATIVSEDFRDTEDLDGLFSGFDPETRTYDPTSWQYAGQEQDGDDRQDHQTAAGDRQRAAARVARLPASHGHPQRDETLQHPRCVYQILKRHFARYTPEMVEQSLRHLRRRRSVEVCEAWTANSGRERTTALVYSVGWTQHSVGVQYIRTGAILQLLLGNMGRPGGGIMALRGHASIQGSTDIPTLFNLLPGYLPMPNAQRPPDPGGRGSTASATRVEGLLGQRRAPTASTCSRPTGATPRRRRTTSASTTCPRITGDHGTYRTVLDMIDGKVKGYFLLGQNPAVGSAHGRAQRLGMANLDWLVVRDLFEIESATFWKNSPEIETGEIVPEECRTEVFLLPGRLARGEGGHLHPDPADAAVAGEGGRAGRRLPLRAVVLLPPRPDGPGAAGRLHRPERDRPLLDLAWDYPIARERTTSPAPRPC